MQCKICGKKTKERYCNTCLEFYRWKFKVRTKEEALEKLELQDRRTKNVEKTLQRKKRGGGKR